MSSLELTGLDYQQKRAPRPGCHPCLGFLSGYMEELAPVLLPLVRLNGAHYTVNLCRACISVVCFMERQSRLLSQDENKTAVTLQTQKSA